MKPHWSKYRTGATKIEEEMMKRKMKRKRKRRKGRKHVDEEEDVQ